MDVQLLVIKLERRNKIMSYCSPGVLIIEIYDGCYDLRDIKFRLRKVNPIFRFRKEFDNVEPVENARQEMQEELEKRFNINSDFIEQLYKIYWEDYGDYDWYEFVENKTNKKYYCRFNCID